MTAGTKVRMPRHFDEVADLMLLVAPSAGQ